MAERIVAKAELSPESVRFYASLVDYCTVYKLKRMEPPTARLYLLCFVHDRYRQLHDHLIDALRSLMRRYLDEAARMAKEALFEHRRQAEADLEQGVSLLRLYVDPAIDDDIAFGEVHFEDAALVLDDPLHLETTGERDGWVPCARGAGRPMGKMTSRDGEPGETSEARRARLEALAAADERTIDTSDAPELTEAALADAERGRFFRPRKQQITARIDADVLAWLRASGPGYQSRLNAILREAMLRER